MDAFMLNGFNQHVPLRRNPAPKVSLAARSHIESMDAGLTSVSGAQEVIKDMLSRRSVTKLILGHNALGDEGCEELFGFLSSEAGRKYKICEISLNSNGIGNRGLLAISRYLRDNTNLKELFLQNNNINGDPSVAVVFALAINTSRLETLALAHNLLSDSFIAHFLPVLDAPYFREIHFSVCGLTQESIPHLVEYLASPRCQLHVLKLNGNQLRGRDVRNLVRAIRRANYTLLRLELYAMGLTKPPNDSELSSEEDDDSQAQPARWQDVESDLKRSLTRNSTLKHIVEKEALALLRYSRVLLLRPKARDAPPSSHPVSPCSESCSCVQLSTNTLFSSIGQPYPLSSLPATDSHFPFTKLPTELQLYILSFLAPMLSNAQRIRIFTYASSPSTLPTLLPCLTNGGCIPDPASPQFTMGGPAAGGFGLSTGVTLRKRGGGSVSACANGKCMGAGNSVLCRREAERSQWLASVRCTAFELEDEETERQD